MFCFVWSVWSDDNWLQKYSGATLKKDNEVAAGEDAAETVTGKRPAEESEDKVKTNFSSILASTVSRVLFEYVADVLIFDCSQQRILVDCMTKTLHNHGQNMFESDTRTKSILFSSWIILLPV